MGNTVARGSKAKVMKIDGQMLKLKTPVRARDVVKDYPGYVLLESDAVKHYGTRAKPLEPQQALSPKKTYFLVELPSFPEEKEARIRRVRSGINMSAKDRLECLMLSRRAVSDLSIVSPLPEGPASDGSGPMDSRVRVKVRLPKAQVQKLMEESRDGSEVAEKIIDLYMKNPGEVDGNDHRNWKPELGSIPESFKPPKKRVSFVPDEGEIGWGVASR